jgi:hypothetical protein
MNAMYNGKTRFMPFGPVGSPDIVCVINGQHVGIDERDRWSSAFAVRFSSLKTMYRCPPSVFSLPTYSALLALRPVGLVMR